MKKNILIVAGETSGDIHASNLVNELKKMNPELSFFGIGGKRMEDSGVRLVERMEKLSIIGISEIFFKLKEIRRAYKKIMDRVNENPPDLVILVDYPGFNLALAKTLKESDRRKSRAQSRGDRRKSRAQSRENLRIIYYITPQVWAWGMWRIHSIKKYVDKAIVILKFEESLLRKYGVDATFVGHPLLDHPGKPSDIRKEPLGLKPDKFTIALLPGSRESEVKNMLPIMLETAKLLVKSKDIQFVLLKSSSVEELIYRDALQKTKINLASIKDDAYACLSIADFVFVSSGTATLETAVAERPMLITYKTSFLTAILFRILAKVRFIGLVNIIAKREIAPEILQYDASPKRLSAEILAIISSKEKMEEQIRGLREIKKELGLPGASYRAAQIIASFIP